MKIATLCIGEELLDGRIQDSNTQSIARVLMGLGHRLSMSLIIGDDYDMGVAQLLSLGQHNDMVVVTGGLGPTSDDITREIAQGAFGGALVFDQAAHDRMTARFERRGLSVSENNRRQCMFLEGTTILPNEVGSASGFMIEHDSTIYYFVPGVPSECMWFVGQYIVPRLAGASYVVEQLHVLGLPESHVETKLEGIERIATQVQVAYCASFPIIEVTLTGRDDVQVGLVAQFVKDRLSDWIVGDGQDSLRQRVANALLARGAKVSTAESCTSGYIGGALTDLAGSSAWFGDGFLTYSNQSKQKMVGVAQAQLEAHGAVSPQVVVQMAQGCAQQTGSMYGVAVSGIAGPGGATPHKPVGTVHFGLQTPQGCYHMTRCFEGLSRKKVRGITVEMALAMLLWALDGTIESRAWINGPYEQAHVLSGIEL